MTTARSATRQVSQPPSGPPWPDGEGTQEGGPWAALSDLLLQLVALLGVAAFGARLVGLAGEDLVLGRLVLAAALGADRDGLGRLLRGDDRQGDLGLLALGRAVDHHRAAGHE